MKKQTVLMILVVALSAFMMSSCVEEKTIEVVVKVEQSAVFSHVNETSENFLDQAVVQLSQDIDDALEEAGLSRDDVVNAVLVGSHYGNAVLEGHDWVVSGAVTVERSDLGGTADVLINYTSQSVAAAVGQKIPTPMEAAGVAVIQGAIDAYLTEDSPELTFTVNNGDVVPSPSVSDPLTFSWTLWITIHAIVNQTLDVPDPF